MKETVKINLNQRLFDLDADAYSRLKDYLDSLHKYFDKKPNEAEEIIQDIEQRIAEILEDKLKGNKQVVTLADIEEIINMMGTVDDFASDNDATEAEFQQEESENKKSAGEDYSRDYRRLHRDLENNILGGVCAGIAAYFNIDPVWVRFAFVLLLFANGVGLLIYIILWAVVPAARTTAQRLQMKGRPVTVENIKESVKSEYGKVKENFHRYSQSESFKRSRDTANEIFTTLGQIFLVMIKVVLIIVGVGLAIALIAFLLGVIGVVATGWSIHAWQLPTIPFGEHIGLVFHNISFFSIALMLVVLIPLVSILAGIIKLVFNIRIRYGILSAFAWTIWSLALVFVIISLISGKNLVSNTYKEKDESLLELNDSKPLYISIDDSSLSGWKIGYYSFFGMDIIHNKINDVCYLEPRLYIRKSDDNSTRLVIEKTSTIPPFWDDNYNDFQYEWYQQDTMLVFDNYFKIDEDDIWQLPGMNIFLYLPDGQKLFIDKSLKELMENKNKEECMTVDYNTRLIMENGRLKALNP